MLYEDGLGVFLLVTVMLGGGAASLTGRAIAADLAADGGRLIAYMLILGAAVRFLHFALFGGTLLSLHYYLVDSAWCCMSCGLARLPAARARRR